MPRRNRRRREQARPVKLKPDRVVELITKVTAQDRDVYPGWIMAAAEYREEA